MMINRIMCVLNILTDLCFTKQKLKNKKYFYKSCLQCFSSRNVLTKHKENCLSINGAQPVRLEKGTIELKNNFKQILVPFKIYADFGFSLKSVEIYEGFCSHSLQFSNKAVCVDVKFSKPKPIVVFRGKNAVHELIKAISKEYEYCRKVMKKHFNKNLILS